MLSYFLGVFSYSLESSVSVTTLTISGNGDITQTFVRSSGDYKAYTDVIIKEGAKTIASLAFEDCYEIRSYQLPSSLTSIASTAFRFNNKLSKFTFPNGNNNFEVDDQGALYTKDKLELIKVPSQLSSFIIPDTVTKICEQSFQTSIQTNINIPISVQTIESGFIFDSSISLVTFSKPATIFEFKDNSFAHSNITSIEIPNSVTVLRTNCFSESQQLSSVTFEEDSQLQSIEKNAFYKNPIKEIIFPNQLTTLSESSFSTCSQLTTVHFSSSISSIDINAFTGCTNISQITIDNNPNFHIDGGVLYDTQNKKMILLPNTLTTLTLPSSLESICTLTIQICLSLTEINVAEGSNNFHGEDGILYSANKEKAIACCGGRTSVNMLSTVKELSPYCFYKCIKLQSIYGLQNTQLTLIGSYCFDLVTIEQIQLPSTVVDIYDYAFNESKIQRITFEPSSLTRINDWAFHFASIQEFSFGPKFQNLGLHSFRNSLIQNIKFDEECPLETISEYSFAYCNKLESVQIPNNVKTIGRSAFLNCESLKTLEFTSSSELSNIGENGFQNCYLIEEINFPSSLVSISNYGFAYCYKLTSITFDTLMTTDNPQLKTLAPSSFMSCSLLNNVHLPASLETIDNSVFVMCTSLENFSISSDNTNLSVIDGLLFDKDGDTLILVPAGRRSVTVSSSVKQFGSNAFYNCINLETCVFQSQSNLQKIPENTFYNCISFKEITIPDSVEIIEQNAFYSCSNLSVVTFSSNSQLKNIGPNTFYGCKSLSNITFGSNAHLETIGENSFANCQQLETITIPNNVTEIGSNCFADCVSLSSVIFAPKSSLTKFQTNTFSNCQALRIFTFPDSIQTISSGIFSNCPNLKCFKFAESSNINSFETGCFSGLNVDVIEFTDSCTINTIKTKAFSDSKIINLELPNCQNIEQSAFANCLYLESFSINFTSQEISNNQLSIFNNNCFEGCDKLQRVALPDLQASITYSISESCFKDCISLSVFPFQKCSQLGSHSFENCKSINSISFSCISEIGNSTFKGCIGLTSLVLEGYQGNILPDSCFEGCSSIKKVSFSNQITEIHSNCFKDCTSLNIKTLPNTIEVIQDYAFFNTGLRNRFIIPSSISQIGSSAFLSTQIKHVIFCGSIWIDSENPAFPVDVFVTTNYKYPKIAGVKAIKRLTSNCILIPTQRIHIHISFMVLCSSIMLIPSILS